jgi:hypothetical protein
METLILIGMVALITWAVINKRYGILGWMAACFTPAALLWLALVLGFIRGEETLYALVLFVYAITGGFVIFLVGLAINGLRK